MDGRRPAWAALLIVLGGIVWPNAATRADDPVVLRAAFQPPYLLADNQQLSGTAVETIECVFDKMNRTFQLDAAPRRRMAAMANAGQIDGYLLSVLSHQDSGVAQPSAPLALEKWYWVSKTGKGIDVSEDAKIKSVNAGAVLGSNELDFLEKFSVDNVQSVAETSDLLTMIRLERIDATIMDLDKFRGAVANNQGDQEFELHFLKYTPLVAYFSDRFLRGNSDFLDRFNEFVHSCSPVRLLLETEEYTYLKDRLVEKFKTIAASQDVISAIRTQNQQHETLSEEAILELDRKWQEARFDTDGQRLISLMLENPVSESLRRKKLDSGGLITELFITDNKGLNVAMSDQTSDYWQGDEEKFRQSFHKGPEAVFIDDIKFDASSLKFQSHIGLTVSENGQPIGAIIAGVDVEKALQGLRKTGY